MQKPNYPWKVFNSLTFKPTVGQLIDLSEENYAMLLKLAPDLPSMQGKFLSSRLPHIDLHLEILEQSPYTSLIHLTYFFDHSTSCRADPDTILRAYHDSKQLEVIDLKQKSLPVTQIYHPPGLLMKWRVNVFLSKWLSYCLHQQHRFNQQHMSTGASEKISNIY